MQLQDVKENIKSRRNKIFLLVEELRRLWIQQRIRGRRRNINRAAVPDDELSKEMLEIQSTIPFLRHVVR
ncbi:unnamed protein product [Linum trigynum]|uniref:Uncharacterized protein n=1 Tax=Linum trigynum TaxID=586398 RepID=A0AAV2F9A9_9ROSI